ncbi:hypothetical protein BH09BAC1_BH09BAC1_00150 [soil metagenome]
MRLSNIQFNGSFFSLVGGPVVVFTIITAILAILFALVWNVNMWEGWTLGTGGGFAEFCEQNRMKQFIRQPANTWSNLAYLFYGLLCIRLALYDKKHGTPPNLITRWPVLSYVYAFTFVYLCIGSFFYHASLTRIGQHFDMGGTYALVAFPAVVNLGRIYKYYATVKEKNLVIGTVVFSFVLFALIFAFKWYLKAEYVLSGLILTVIVTTIWYHALSKAPYQMLFGLLAILSVVLAYFIWWQDRYKHWCDPESYLQGHAFWHVLTGLSGFFIYLMLRSEQPIVAKAQD